MKRLLVCVLAFGATLFAQDGTPVNQSDGPPSTRWTRVYSYDASNNLEYVCYTEPWAGQPTYTWTMGSTLTSIVDSSNTATVTTSAAHGLKIGNVVTIAGGLVATWAAADITSVVDAANTSTITFGAAHGLDTSDIITLSGFTTDTDLNGTYLFTKSDATSGTITTASVTDGTYTAATDSGMAIGLGDTDLSGSYVVATTPLSTTFTITTASVTDGNYNEGTGTTLTTISPRTTASIWFVRRYQYDTSSNLISSQWARGSVASKVVTRGVRFACSSLSALVYE